MGKRSRSLFLDVDMLHTVAASTETDVQWKDAGMTLNRRRVLFVVVRRLVISGRLYSIRCVLLIGTIVPAGNGRKGF